MRVRLAAQTFSISVADALEYCRSDIAHKEFQDAEPTIIFCIVINNVFDILYTRNFLSKNTFNKPINSNNKESIIKYIDEAIDYIKKLQCIDIRKKSNSNTRLVVESNRKTGFVGLHISLKSFKNLTSEIQEK